MQSEQVRDRRKQKGLYKKNYIAVITQSALKENYLKYNWNSKMAKNNKMLINIVVMMAVICLCSGSAIPMWEYLSRGEKVRIANNF